MAKEIQTGIRLTFKDLYSEGLKRAGINTSSFGGGVMSVMDKINSATNTVGGKLATLGVSIGVGAAVNNLINYEARLERMATNADIGAERLKNLKDQIYETSQAPDIKVDPSELTSALEEILERTGDIDFATENIRNLGLTIQASGASGEAIGGLFSEFQKAKLGAQDMIGVIDVLTKQGKAGAFSLENLAALGPRLLSSYGAARTLNAESAKDLGATMQIIRKGVGTAEQSATAFEALVRELTDPAKQVALKKMGVNVRDLVTKEFRAPAEVLADIIERGKKKGNLDAFGAVFGGEAMRAINAWQLFGDGYEDLMGLMGDGSTVLADSARNAQTAKAGLVNLQTAFNKFADSNLTGPINALADGLNKLSENPAALQTTFGVITAGLIGIAAVKGVSGVVNMVNGLRSLKNAKLDVTAGLTGGAQPVMVTNWPMGFGASGSGIPGLPNGKSAPVGKTNGLGNLLGKAGQIAGTATVAWSVVSSVSELIDRAAADRNRDYADTTFTGVAANLGKSEDPDFKKKAFMVDQAIPVIVNQAGGNQAELERLLQNAATRAQLSMSELLAVAGASTKIPLSMKAKLPRSALTNNPLDTLNKSQLPTLNVVQGNTKEKLQIDVNVTDKGTAVTVKESAGITPRVSAETGRVREARGN